VVGGGLGVKKRVAEDGEQLVDRIHVHVADEVERVAACVGGCSGADALDAPGNKLLNFWRGLEMFEVEDISSFRFKYVPPMMRLGGGAPDYVEVRAAAGVLEGCTLLHKRAARGSISLDARAGTRKDGDGCEEAWAVVCDN
jgi:hypothetical protein